MNFNVLNTRKVIEGCIESLSIEGLEMERNVSQKTSKRKKEPGKYGFDFSQISAGLFQTKSDSKSSKIKDHGESDLMDAEMNGSKQGNILTSATKERRSNSSFDMNLDGISDTSMHSIDDDTVRQDKVGEAFGNANRMNVVSDENFNFSEMDIDSMDFSVNMEQTETEASSLHEKNVGNLVGISSHFGGIENDEDTYRHFLGEEMRNHEKEPTMVRDEASNEFEFAHSPSSACSIDLQFNKYLTETNFLVKEATDCLRRQGSDRHAEDSFYESAIMLSKAIDIRPMSLLAVGQLGNTYLLHGELKLRISRDLRTLLTDAVSVNRRTRIRDGLDDTVPREDNITSYLLIADIGPGAARDADKVFLAAIDKFDAMMSRGNVYAPDALFRWATALQHRSRLRTRTSREKVKLLQQAQRTRTC
ncbi:hypothetical protein K7X08_033290 [Anisodus acutangulus]|uniref:Uncharacterized protein n=1 Tax=Anisodus acutangulus TaxID=402998 RepID=A0A9Q1M1R9_9SOLA|nr:hypothetical protein K7X08_033290 [Anisodus acutangulus]